MNKRFIALVLLNVVCVLESSAQNCVCAKVPIYPIPGSTEWFHYAIVTNSNCDQLYPTGKIRDPFIETCEVNTCGTCSSLPSGKVVVKDSHYEGPLPKYDSMKKDAEFRWFLKLHADNSSEYDGWDFTNVRLIKLVRVKDGKKEDFYAVVWKMGKASKPSVYVGVEIATPPAGITETAITSQFNAVSTTKENDGSTKHTPVPGILQVGFSKDDCFDIAFVRLHKPSNVGVTYPPLDPKPCKTGNNGNARLQDDSIQGVSVLSSNPNPAFVSSESTSSNNGHIRRRLLGWRRR